MTFGTTPSSSSITAYNSVCLSHKIKGEMGSVRGKNGKDKYMHDFGGKT